MQKHAPSLQVPPDVTQAKGQHRHGSAYNFEKVRKLYFSHITTPTA